MANNEVVKILRVETQGSERTVKSLKDEISALKDALLNTQQGTQQYDDIVKQLRQDQEDLTRVMNAGKKDVEALEGSYNYLVKTMGELKKEWRATTDEVRRNQLGQEIDNINNQLKEMDASIGNYQRNVGNYAGGFSEAMKEIQSSTEVTRAKFESVSKIATGVASGYAAIQGATALLGVENSKLQETFVKLQAAIALAQGIGGMKDLIEGLGMAKVAFKSASTGCKTFISSLRGVKGAIAATGIGVLVIALGALIERFSTLNDKMEEAKDISKRLNDSIDASNKILAHNQKIKEINALEEYRKAVVAAAGDVDKLTAAQKAYGEAMTAIKKETLTSNIEYWRKQIKDTQFDLEVQKSVIDDMKKEIDDRGYFDLELDNNKALVALGEFLTGYEPIQEGVIRLSEQDVAQLEENLERLKEALENAENLKIDFDNEELLNYLNKTVDAAVDAEKEKTQAAEKGAKERKAIAQKEAEERAALAAEREKEIHSVLDKIAESNRTAEEQELYELDKTYNEEKELLKGRNADLLALEELYNRQRQEIITKYRTEEALNNKEIIFLDLETENSFAQQETENKFEEKEVENPIQGIQVEIDKLKELEELRLKLHNDKLEQIDILLSAEILSAEIKMNLETEKANLIRENAIEEARYIIKNSELQKQKIEEEKRLKRTQVESSIDVTRNLLDATSKLFKDNTKAQKGIATAVATIDALKSANSAYSAMAGIPYVGPVLGAAAAAAALVAGYANVKAIWETNEDGSNANATLGSSSSSYSVTPSFNASEAMPIDYTRNIMTDTELDEINKPQKVYVLESDITETQNKVEVTENNATF